MNYLSGALRYVAGGESDTKDVVPRLIDRIKTSALPQDRRSAIAALTEAAKLSPQRQVLVGELGIKIIYAVLEQDKNYDDTLKATLDLLIAICGTLDPPAPEKLSAILGEIGKGVSEQGRQKVFEEKSAHAATTNVDMFLGLPNSVSLLLDLLETKDFYVKFGTIELLTAMAANSRNTLQMAVLEAPQGVSRICDLLDDDHRHVRSNAVLLLSTLCDESPEICKIVAFGGVLEKLFALIESVSGESRVTVAGIMDDDDDEDSLESAIVVQDVLLVVRNLIRGASTTRTFFRDTGCLPRLVNVVKKSSADANMLAGGSVGVKSAAEGQARKNLLVAMHCISGLVQGGDNESKLVKDHLATTNLFKVLAHLAFNLQLSSVVGAEKASESGLHVRVTAWKTLALLARGHDDFRAMFTSSSFTTGENGEALNAQVAALRAMSKDPSSAVRVSAYSALRESFVVDAGLDLPSSNLLNAMTGSGGPSSYAVAEQSSRMRSRTMSSGDLSSPANAMQFIAESLKTALVGWPNDADAAAVFYAASIVSWVVDRVQGARERLLASYVNGGALLPQIFRVLGKLEREKGPPEVRIALFSLGCTWLRGNPSAVSAFLSSAMHLPLLVDVLKSSGSRGDLAEVHVRGLAAVLLGICLQVSESAAFPTSCEGFLSGGGGGSVVIPRGTVTDVIRNRVGVTEFTACLEDLRASKSFSSGGDEGNMWQLADKLVEVEGRADLLSAKGSLGHDNWYGPVIVSTINEIYKEIGARALDLLSEQSSVPVGSANGPAPVPVNGHPVDVSRETLEGQAVLASSSRDEVLNSYKEFIRSQDESLEAARRQIEELSTALRETQLELDSRANEVSAAKNSGDIRKLHTANEELTAQKEALEVLLEEKTTDFSALSEAYAALEEEHSNQKEQELPPGDAASSRDLASLRSQNAAIRESLSSEAAKNAMLVQRAAVLESTLHAKEAELAAIGQERDMLNSNVQPEVVEAFQWRTRAEVAEASVSSRQTLLDSLQKANTSLELRLREMEQARDEASLSASALDTKLSAATAELDDLKSTRKRELRVSRESSSAANAAAQKEIAVLKAELQNAREALSAPSPAISQLSADEKDRFESLQKDHEVLQQSFDHLKTELVDTKSALVQWQKKGEATEASKEREALEHNRLSTLLKEREAEVRSLKDSFSAQNQAAAAFDARIAELEQRGTEMDEIRSRAEEESKALKEEIATRAEQSIRLSGQLYEAEESRNKLEEELHRIQEKLISTTEELQVEKRKPSAGVGNDGVISEQYTEKVSTLQEELEATKDALADIKDRESLLQAQARDRDEAVEKSAFLEQNLLESAAREAVLASEVDELKQRLLSLDEAEEAKRALTAQVVALQKSVADLSNGKAGGKNARSGLTKSITEMEKEVDDFRTQVREKDMRLKELESSLNLACDQGSSVLKEKSDAEKQLAEAETMLSVLRSERDSLAEKCSQLEIKVSEIASSDSEDSAALQQVRQELQASESKRSAIAAELTSLVEACRDAERETLKMRGDNSALESKVLTVDRKMQEIRDEKESLALSIVVSEVVNAVTLEVAFNSESQKGGDALRIVRNERDAALALLSKSSNEMKALEISKTGLEGALKDRNELEMRTADQAQRITELTAKVKEVEAITQENADLSKSLRAANASMKSLKEENSTLSEAKLGHGPVAGSTFGEGHVLDSAQLSTLSGRVQELEGALRDAARTVSATNLELIAAQALLVELSADKTAIRNELSEAHGEIRTLNAKLSVGARGISQNEPALSEVSEPEQSLPDSAIDSSTVAQARVASEQALTASKAESTNLRTALERTTLEANSAHTLLESIEEKLGAVEDKLRHSQVSLEDSRGLEEKLERDMEKLRENAASEKTALLGDIEALNGELAALRSKSERVENELQKRLFTVQEAKASEKKVLEDAVSEKENAIEAMTNECTDLQAELEESSKKLRRFSEKTMVLEESNSKYASTIMALEGTITSVNKRLDDSENRGSSLEESLALSQQELTSKCEEFGKERQELDTKHRKEISEFEAEIDRSSKALEDAERHVRDVEHSLKREVSDLKASVKRTAEQLDACRKELDASIAECKYVKSEKDAREAQLSGRLEEKTEELSRITADRDAVRNLLDVRTDERDSATQDLSATKEELRITKSTLEEEIEHKLVLETESQDMMETISALEATSKGLRENLIQKEKQLEDKKSKIEGCEKVIMEQAEVVEGLKEEVIRNEESVKQLRSARAKLEDESDRLRESLDSAESGKEAAERDNTDLKAWVADLERQATELQSAAENFEDVEQSLREALDTQRDVTEHNGKLTEDLKRERDALAKAEGEVRGAIREKQAAKSARDAAQRRANDLEDRIREIRDEHLAKVSRSEEAIRAKAQRCAELETALASSERKVAELASASDSLFGAKAELSQRDEEVRGLRERAEAGERRVEELQGQIQTMQGEVSEMRESGSGDAYRVLEAEHNELLVCLADLELECTILKEELGRE